MGGRVFTTPSLHISVISTSFRTAWRVARAAVLRAPLPPIRPWPSGRRPRKVIDACSPSFSSLQEAFVFASYLYKSFEIEKRVIERTDLWRPDSYIRN